MHNQHSTPVRTHCKTRSRLGAKNRPFAASHSGGTKPPCWRAKVALGLDKQKTYKILNDNFHCLSCPSATFILQHGRFVPPEWLAVKGLFKTTHCILTAQTSKQCLSSQKWGKGHQHVQRFRFSYKPAFDELNCVENLSETILLMIY